MSGHTESVEVQLVEQPLEIWPRIQDMSTGSEGARSHIEGAEARAAAPGRLLDLVSEVTTSSPSPLRRRS